MHVAYIVTFTAHQQRHMLLTLTCLGLATPLKYYDFMESLLNNIGRTSPKITNASPFF